MPLGSQADYICCIPQGVEDSVVAVFRDPVQHREARDEVLLVEQGWFLSEQGVDVRPGACSPFHKPGVLPVLQRNRRLTTTTDINLIN